jgi:dethiobiotin synthetase
MDLFVSAIHTDSGKTLVSAILCEALNADYWKPIQSGEPRDVDTIARLIRNPQQRIHPSTYDLKVPVSPHQSAAMDGVHIAPNLILRPACSNTLIIEGAGGLLVPLAPQYTIADLIAQLRAPLVLVSNYYLGSINHTLLSLHYIKSQNLPLKGIIFNGRENKYSRQAIMASCPAPVLMHLPPLASVNQETVQELAEKFKSELDVLN